MLFRSASLLPQLKDCAKDAKNEPLPNPEILIFEAIAFFTIAEASKGDLGHDFVPAIEQLMEQTTNTMAFSFLWGLKNRSQKKTKTVERFAYGNEPSLVASYQRFNSIDKAEELAHAAGQPFRV